MEASPCPLFPLGPRVQDHLLKVLEDGTALDGCRILAGGDPVEALDFFLLKGTEQLLGQSEIVAGEVEQDGRAGSAAAHGWARPPTGQPGNST